MANKTIDSVTTFVAEMPGLPLDRALEKFQGSRTLRTVEAARRIAAKKRKVKIPRNLLRQLWRATGGWSQNLESGWERIHDKATKMQDSRYKWPDHAKAIWTREVDFTNRMKVFFLYLEGSLFAYILLKDRGEWMRVASVAAYSNGGAWMDRNIAISFAQVYGVEVSGQLLP